MGTKKNGKIRLLAKIVFFKNLQEAILRGRESFLFAPDSRPELGALRFRSGLTQPLGTPYIHLLTPIAIRHPSKKH